MGKYKLSELLTEVAGGRIGTLEISARDLVRKMEDLEDKGVRVDRFDGLSPDGKTYIEFHVHPMRKYDEDTSLYLRGEAQFDWFKESTMVFRKVGNKTSESKQV